MKKGILLFTLFCLLLVSNCKCQTLGDFLKKKAIEVKFADAQSASLLIDQIKSNRLIMVGEMHGTKEPAMFVNLIVEALLKTGVNIQLGLEIPEGMLGEFLKRPSVRNLKRSPFFSSGYADGRASEDWFNLIKAYSSNEKVKLFFYDADDKEVNPDSLMYTKVKYQIVNNTNSITITLGGNIHNRFIPFKTMKTMGYYLKSDMSLDVSGKICSVYHEYLEGSMINNMGSGLQLSKIEPRPSVYSESTNFENYFCKFPDNSSNPFNAILYTKKVSAATILNQSKSNSNR